MQMDFVFASVANHSPNVFVVSNQNGVKMPEMILNPTQ